MYNYLGTIKKPSAVSFSLNCKFTNSVDMNLLLVKLNNIEIFKITSRDIEQIKVFSIYGKIIMIEPVNYLMSKHSEQRQLFILTDDLDWSILHYTDFGLIETLCKGNIKQTVGKRIQLYYTLCNDYILFNAYDNVMTVVFINEFMRTNFSDYSFRYDYDEIIAIEKINFCDDFNDYDIIKSNSNKTIHPQVFGFLKVVSYKKISNNNINSNIFSGNSPKTERIIFDLMTFDNIKDKNLEKRNSNRRSKDYSNFSIDDITLNIKKSNNSNIINNKKIFNNEILDFYSGLYLPVPWEYNLSEKLLDFTNSPNISMIISPDIGGLLVFTTNNVTYYQIFKKMTKSNNDLEKNSSILNSFKIDEIQSFEFTNKYFNHYCKIDSYRYLISDDIGNLFFLGFVNKNKFIFQFLGETTIASTISYLDNNYVFVGSKHSNSQIIKILQKPSDDIKKVQIELVEELLCLAPIYDYVKIDNNDSKFICVTGVGKHCNLKTVRKAVSIEALGEFDLKLIKKVYSFKSNYQGKSVSSFLFQTLNKDYLFNLVDSNLEQIKLTFDSKHLIFITNLIGNTNPNNSINTHDNYIILNEILFLSDTSIYVFDSHMKNVLYSEDFSKKLFKNDREKIINCSYYDKNNSFLIFTNFYNLFLIELTIDQNNKSKSVYLNTTDEKDKLKMKLNLSCMTLLQSNITSSFLIYLYNINTESIEKRKVDYNDDKSKLLLTQYENIYKFNENDKKENFTKKLTKNLIICMNNIVQNNLSYLICGSNSNKIFLFSIDNNSSDYLLTTINVNSSYFSFEKVFINKKQQILISSTYNNNQAYLFEITQDNFPVITTILDSNNNKLNNIIGISSSINEKNNNKSKISSDIKNKKENSKVLNVDNNMNMFIFDNCVKLGRISSHQSQNVSGKNINNQIYSIEYLNEENVIIYVNDKDIDGVMTSYLSICDSNLKLIKEIENTEDNEQFICFSIIDQKKVSPDKSLSLLEKKNLEIKEKQSKMLIDDDDDVMISTLKNENIMNSYYLIIGTSYKSSDISKEPEKGRLLMYDLSFINPVNLSKNNQNNTSIKIEFIDKLTFNGGVNTICYSNLNGIFFISVNDCINVIKIEKKAAILSNDLNDKIRQINKSSKHFNLKIRFFN
jgi:hypothetical protein